MLTPEYPAAVVAGNVETSQAVTNCLFGALGALACAQGTMNNLNFGNAKYQYYETICSGSPAGPGFDGTDAVHTHMTNTRLTDPEVLEFRYPVVLEDFHIRKGSGGRGKWNAGDGIRRTIRFLEKMDCTILSGHRRVPPFGLAGGETGQVGREFGAPQGRHDREAARLRRDRDRRRRGDHHPDADRGRVWQYREWSRSMIRVVLAGVTGWVGRALLPAIVASDRILKLVGAVSRKAAGQDAGDAAGAAPVGRNGHRDFGRSAERTPSDVLVDYTKPESVGRNVLEAIAAGRHVVIGTSGLGADEYAAIDKAARDKKRRRARGRQFLDHRHAAEEIRA